MPNSTQSLDIGKNSDGGISDLCYFWPVISGQSLMKVNSHNSRTSDVIDIKFGPVTKLDKKNNTVSQIFDNDVLWQTMTSLSFFRFMANLEHSLTVTFYLTKPGNRTKKSLTQFSHICFE